MIDKKLERLFSELTEEEIKAVNMSDIDTDCEIDEKTLSRISNKVQMKTGLRFSDTKAKTGFRCRRKLKAVLIAAAMIVIFAVTTGAAYRFIVPKELEENLGFTSQYVKTVIDTENVDEGSVQVLEKTVNANGYTVTFEAIVEGYAMRSSFTDSLKYITHSVDKTYAIFTIRRDDGKQVFYNGADSLNASTLGYTLLLHGYAPSTAMFHNDAGYYEENNVLYMACDITDAYMFADKELSIAIIGQYFVDGTILRMNENGDFYYVDTYDGIKAMYDFDIDDKYADSEAAKSHMEGKPFMTEIPDYSESDKIIALDEAFKNSGSDLSYAIGEYEWKGSYPLQFGEIDHAEEFKALQENRPTDNVISVTELSELVWALQTKYSFELRKTNYLERSDIPDKFTSQSFSDGSEYYYVGENLFLYFPSGEENGRLILVLASRIVIALEGDNDNIYNALSYFPEHKAWPGFMSDIWYLDGVDPDSRYAKYYDEEHQKHYVENCVSSDTDAIYYIVITFANFEGTVQVFDK